MYATVEGLAERYKEEADALLERDPDVEVKLHDVEARIVAYMPQIPKFEHQYEAATNATYAQYEYEQSDAAKQMMGLPNVVEGFSIGKFSVNRNRGAGGATQKDALFPAGISSTARAYLLEAGLLFRGVN